MKKRNVIIGAILIVLAIVVVIMFTAFGADENENVQEKVSEDVAVSELERQQMLTEINKNANDATDMDEKTAKKIMNLEIAIPDEIAEVYFDGDTSFFCEELEKYLVEEDFALDITWAKCNQTVTWDHLKGIVYLDLTLNDNMKTTVTAQYYRDDEYVKFNYY